jgi:hypothetical protein
VNRRVTNVNRRVTNVNRRVANVNRRVTEGGATRRPDPHLS